MWRLIIETLTLGTPRGRIMFLVLASLVIFAAPYAWLSKLSLLSHIGWDWAPSIGLTRAYHLLLHGDMIGAWHRNWIIFPVMLLWGIIVVLDIRKILGKKVG